MVRVDFKKSYLNVFIWNTVGLKWQFCVSLVYDDNVKIIFVLKKFTLFYFSYNFNQINQIVKQLYNSNLFFWPFMKVENHMVNSKN